MLRQIDFALDTFLPNSTIGLKAFEAQQSNALGSPHFAFDRNACNNRPEIFDELWFHNHRVCKVFVLMTSLSCLPVF